MISLSDGKKLVRLARQSVLDYFSGKDTFADPEIEKKFSENQGVFVTLTKGQELRGCIGFVEGVMPLNKAIIRMARAAAFDDPRFPPVEGSEIKVISFEVSVLTVPDLIVARSPDDYVRKIKIGRDGLIIRSRYGSGLLLPQVAVEWGWDVREFLEHTCMKAGLPKEAWMDLSNHIYSFSAQIFSEQGSTVVEKKY